MAEMVIRVLIKNVLWGSWEDLFTVKYCENALTYNTLSKKSQEQQIKAKNTTMFK